MTSDRTLAAAALIIAYATIIGFTDNFVTLIARNAGLWQFHATRSAMGIAILLAVSALSGLRLRPRRMRGVVARSAVHGAAMMLYFGSLAFLTVAQVAAGLFTAPIFVLLISRFVYGEPIGGVRVLAVVTGFAGALLVLGPSALHGATVAAVLPVVAGALYAMGNIATRKWCEGENAGTLVGGFFVALGLFGIIGMAVLTVWPLPVPVGPSGFAVRGPVVPDGAFWLWTFVQAAGSLLAVSLMIRAYQISDAGRVSVFEYAILPAAAVWGYVIKSETLTLTAVSGMILIAAAGIVIALTGRQTTG